MPIDGIDFEGVANEATNNSAATDTNVNPTTQEDREVLSGTKEVEDVTGVDNTNNQSEEGNVESNKVGTTPAEEPSSTGGLEPGMEVEFDGVTYVVDKDGNIVDKEGKIFKAAGDVKAFLDENTPVDEDGPLSIDTIRSAVGVDVLDESGNPIEFTDDVNGVVSYINGVLDLKANDIQQGAINKMFAANPMLKQFIDYVALTGTPRGFGDIPDRSGIVLDKDNPQQLAAVIKMAAQEFGNESLNDNYIKYLESSGSLYDEASAQLRKLVEKDKAVMKQIQDRADQQRKEEEEQVSAYWNNVADAIGKRVIAGYRLPETLVKEIDGKKVTLTPDDFYNYLAEPAFQDEAGNAMTGYQKDLYKLSNEEVLNRELLDAWLMFTGGTYKDLVDMAVKQNEVRKLVIKSRQQHSNKAVKIVKSKQSKVSMDDILLS